jgi:hypothetical protein
MSAGKKFAVVLLTLVGCELERREHALAPAARLQEMNASPVDEVGRQAVDFALAGASAFTVSVEGCASGYSATLTEQTPAANLYTGDHGCLGKLLDVTISALRYQPLGGSSFQTWRAGEQAVYVNSDTGQTINVAVQQQLSNPVAPTDTIAFRTSQSLADTTARQILDVRFGASAQAHGPGDTPPGFVIRGASIVGIDPSIDAAYYSFILECAGAMDVPSKDERKSSCDGIKLQSIDYALVEDTFGDRPCESGNLAPCHEIFRRARTSLAPATDIILPGTREAPNGGFTTKTALSEALKTPANLPSHPHMLLVIRAPGPTYQYFNLDISVTRTY